MITRMDRDIGKLVAQLQALGLADNTLVLFTSDNGPHNEGGNDPDFFDSNGPLRSKKRFLYDGGIRVPLIAYWPGTVAPGTSARVGMFDDVLPTLTDLAGASIPAGVTGVSFAPTLRGADQAPRDHLYWEHLGKGGLQAVRWGPWKAVRQNFQQRPDGPIELYDLSQDVGEKQNVARRHPRVVARIEKIMKEDRQTSALEAFRFGWEK